MYKNNVLVIELGLGILKLSNHSMEKQCIDLCNNLKRKICSDIMRGVAKVETLNLRKGYHAEIQCLDKHHPPCNICRHLRKRR